MKRSSILVPIATGVLGLVIGAAGASGSGSVEPTPTPAVTQTVTVSQVPKACLDALDYSDRGFTIAGDGMTAASDGFTAIANNDVAGLEKATSDMQDVTDQLTPLGAKYRAARDTCRAASK